WRRGGELLAAQTDKDALTIDELVAELRREKVARVPGTAVFLTARMKNTPPAVNHHIERSRALHEQVVLLTVLTEDVPRLAPADRLQVEDLRHGFYRVILHYGYMQSVNVPSDLAGCAAQGLEIDLKEATYYIEHQQVIHGRRKGGMIGWRDRLLDFMMHNSPD